MPAAHRLSAGTALLVAALLLSGCGPAPVGPSPSRTVTPTPAATTPAPVAAVTDRCGEATAPDLTAVAFDGLPSGPDFTATAVQAAGRRLTLGAHPYAFTDFVPAGGTFDGAVVGPGVVALEGAGARRTVLRVEPRTSTRAGTIPTEFPGTNQLSVLRVGGDVRYLSAFTVQGTQQGHLYNGLRIDRLVHPVVRDLRITGIPGGASSPPGETFGLNDYRTVGADYARVEVDGAGVGAAGFGANGSRDIRVCASTSHDNPFSMGFAFWQVAGITMVDCRAERNGRAGFNFERVTGTVRLVRPVAVGNRTDMSIASDQGSAGYTIVDPQLTDGRWTVTLPRTYYGKKNRQDRGSIHLVLDGQQRDDLLRFEVR